MVVIDIIIIIMSITTIIGPMFSGKTTEFIRLIKRKQISGKNCLIIKNSIDVRYDNGENNNNHITTHDGQRYQNCDIIYQKTLKDEILINTISNKYNVVGIEEGFFFTGLSYFCNELANRGIDVIVATIDSSFKQELFKEVGDLIAISENVIKLNAICMRCGEDNASFTIRTIESDELILVGANDIYQSVCRKCLNKFKNKSD